MEFCLAGVKQVPVAKTAPLVKATRELVTIEQRSVAENPPTSATLELDLLVMSALPALRLDLLARVSFARARPPRVPSLE